MSQALLCLDDSLLHVWIFDASYEHCKRRNSHQSAIASALLPPICQVNRCHGFVGLSELSNRVPSLVSNVKRLTLSPVVVLLCNCLHVEENFVRTFDVIKSLLVSSVLGQEVSLSSDDAPHHRHGKLRVVSDLTRTQIVVTSTWHFDCGVYLLLFQLPHSELIV